MRRRPRLVLALVAALAAVPAAADAPDPYAYLFLQGKISDATGTQAVAGATVRLSSGSEVFEAVTDQRGVFVFEKLPVTAFEVEVVTADGKPVRGARALTRFDPDRSRVEISTDPGPHSRIRLDTEGERFVVEVRDPPANWRKLWKELLIVIGAAGLFAL